jgi:biopolymer transport protein ExbD
MMRLDDPAPRTKPEPLLPMIDVVFFLVVFFMIVSRFTNAEPFAVARPASTAQEVAAGDLALFLAPDGRLGFAGAAGLSEGEAALAALTVARTAYCAALDCTLPPPLLLHADASAPGSALAQLLPKLSAMGFGELRLITVAQ